MSWRDHVTPDQERIINQQHGTEIFRSVATDLMTLAAFRQLKRKVKTEHHENLEMAWHGMSMDTNPLHGLRDFVDEKIGDFFQELDDQTGGFGQSGAAWVDRKYTELMRHIDSWIGN
jgi:hypothetical protein